MNRSTFFTSEFGYEKFDVGGDCCLWPPGGVSVGDGPWTTWSRDPCGRPQGLCGRGRVLRVTLHGKREENGGQSQKGRVGWGLRMTNLLNSITA